VQPRTTCTQNTPTSKAGERDADEQGRWASGAASSNGQGTAAGVRLRSRHREANVAPLFVAGVIARRDRDTPRSGG
jgi:hypothetical protein